MFQYAVYSSTRYFDAIDIHLMEGNLHLCKQKCQVVFPLGLLETASDAVLRESNQLK